MMQYPTSNGQPIVSRSASIHSDNSNGHSNLDGERPRKRVRKGTRSCWECKRRKVKCQLSSEDVPVCSGCLARGTTCLSQEYPEERDSSSGGTQVGERLGRVEKLLETLVAKISAYEEDDNSRKIMTPESMGGSDGLNDFSTPANVADCVQNAILDNPIIKRHNSSSQVQTPSARSNGPRTPSCSKRPSKLERLQQILADLLPSQEDADLICEAGNCWLLLHAMSPSAARGLTEEDTSPKTLNMAEASTKSPTSIALTLLYLAVCVQQLDPDFDIGQLHLYPSVDVRVAKYLSTIQTLITSDDELVSSLEGVQCVLVQGIYYINAGSPKRAWLNIRRAMSVSQLIGINKKSSSETIPGGHDMWNQLISGDRYLALLLGLPAGSSDDPLDPEDNFQNPAINKDKLFQKKMAVLTTRIIERNQADQSYAYAVTQEIDEKLDALAKEMPASWWELPPQEVGRQTLQSVEYFDRLMTQTYFFQLQALLHLPFMLRAATERRYDYSKFSCLKAARETIWRYLAMRTASNKSFCCRTVDFGALTATVSLFLGTLEHTHGQIESKEVVQQRDSDRALIHRVLQTIERLASNNRDIVAAQSASVIKSLLAVDPPSGENGGNLRLTIPYFGTVSIVRPPQTITTPLRHNNMIVNEGGLLPPPPPPPQQSITIGHGARSSDSVASSSIPYMDYSNQNPMNCPTVSFTSSHLPIMTQEQRPQIQDLSWEDSDTLFFDSLLNSDIEGNWIF